MDLNTIEFWLLWIIGVGLLITFFYRVSRYSNMHHKLFKKNKGNDSSEEFGNYSEQRFLEEDHPVTMSGPYGGAQMAAGREAHEKRIDYYG